MYTYLGVSTTEDDLIPHSVDSTTIRPLQEITSNHINLADHSTISSSTSNYPYHKMPSRGAINYNHVHYDFNKCRDRAEVTGRHHRCPYLDEEDMEVASEDDYEVIKEENNEVSSDEEPLSPIPEQLFENYKTPSTNVNLTDWYNKVQIVPSQTLLPFCFTTSSPVTMRTESLDHLIRLLERTEKPILIPNSHKLLANKDLAAILRNATKNIDAQLDTIHANFQQHRGQHWTDCRDFYCNPMAAVIK